REPGGWRVFLGLAQADAAAATAEVVRLKRLGEQRMARGHIEWALDTYEAAAAMAPKDRGVRHALAMLKSLVDSQRSRQPDPKTYLDRVVIERVTVEGLQIRGEVRNVGAHALDQIELMIVGLDERGNAVTETTHSLSNLSLTAGGNLRFEAAFSEPPKAWKGAVEVRVTRVRFLSPTRQ
ncbi:MAG: FxLYD domain-containing protein, partial [Myxococcota bacterium]